MDADANNILNLTKLGQLRLALEKWISTCPAVIGLTVSPDSRRLYVASGGTKAVGAPVEEYDILTGKRLRVFPFGPYHCHGDVVLSRSGRFLYTTNYYYTYASRLDLRYGGREKRVDLGGVRTAVWASRIGITPDRRLLVVALGQDGRPVDLENERISLLAVDRGRFSLVAQVKLPDEPTGRLTGITADSRWLYLPTYPRRSAEPTLYEIRLADPAGITRRLALPGTRLEDAVVHEKTGKVFVSDRRQNKVWVIDRRTFKVRSKIDLAGTAPGPLRVWRRAGILFAVSPKAGILWAIDPAEERPVARLDGLGNDLYDIEISPDGKRLFTALGGEEGRVCVVRILRKPADPDDARWRGLFEMDKYLEVQRGRGLTDQALLVELGNFLRTDVLGPKIAAELFRSRRPGILFVELPRERRPEVIEWAMKRSGGPPDGIAREYGG